MPLQRRVCCRSIQYEREDISLGLGQFSSRFHDELRAISEITGHWKRHLFDVVSTAVSCLARWHRAADTAHRRAAQHYRDPTKERRDSPQAFRGHLAVRIDANLLVYVVLRDAIAKSTSDKSTQCLKPCDGCGEPARTASLCVESSGERDL